MDPNVNQWLQLLFRWLHLVAGVIWIGHLYFFNFVNAHFAKTLDATSKKAVVPELMPRALFWFRWGAAWTWISGILLLGLVYYMGGAQFDDPNAANVALASGLLVGTLALVYIYDVVLKQVKNVLAANAINLALFFGILALYQFVGGFSGRSIFVHAGAIFGTVMAMNVWMRIWPAQKKIITAIKEGSAPDADLVALAGFRSRQNTFMSVPLLFFMVSNHSPLAYGTGDLLLAYLAGFSLLGFVTVHLIYGKSARVSGF